MIGLTEAELGFVAPYVKEKIDASVLDASNYISTDNMLPNVCGITLSDYVPTTGKVAAYQRNDVLVSNIRPYFKKIWQARQSGGCSNDVLVFRANPKKIVPKFLYYQLSQDDFFDFMMAGANGVKMPRGNRNLIPKYKFQLPPLPIQQKVAGVLSAYDDLIENNLKRIKLLEEMAQITYEQWFLRLRFPGYESVPINSETSLPEGWSKVKLKAVLTLNYGKALKADNRAEGDISVYGSSGIVGTHNEALVKGCGIIVGRKGNVGSVFWSHDSFYPIDTVYFVTSKHTLPFLYFALKNSKFNNSDAAVPGLNRDAAYAVEIMLPPEALEKQFSVSVQQNFKAIELLEIQNQRLREARDILLPRLMTGVIDVESYDPAQLLKDAA